MPSPVDEYENEHWDEITGGEVMGLTCEKCGTTLEQSIWCPKCEPATAAGPERDLADLERLAESKPNGVATLGWQESDTVNVYEVQIHGYGEYERRTPTRINHRCTRAEALALLKGAKDDKG